MAERQQQLDRSLKKFDQEDELWATVRSRLEAELVGALPPPYRAAYVIFGVGFCCLSCWWVMGYLRHIFFEDRRVHSAAACHTDTARARG